MDEIQSRTNSVDADSWLNPSGAFARDNGTEPPALQVERDLRDSLRRIGEGATTSAPTTEIPVNCVPVKTADGYAEMSRRQRGLTQRQRTMLLLVDGRRSVLQVKGVASQAGAPDSCFDDLLALGLISIPEQRPSARVPSAVESAPVPLTLPTLESAPVPLVKQEPGDDSMRGVTSLSNLPASVLGDSMMSSMYPMSESAFGGLGTGEREMERDQMLDEARRVLMRAVRAKAPVTGSLTLIKLRRTRTRQDLLALFEEVDAHISKPIGHLSAQQTLRHVRGLLERPM